MAPTLAFCATADGKNWTDASKVANGESDYGLQMANFRGELYGIMVKADRKLAATKLKVDSGWKDFRSLPDLYKSKGRPAVAVLDDRFYVIYRSSNDHIYMTWTQDFDNWHNAGRIGSQYASTMVAPAIAAYGGKLILTGVGPDKYIYYTICDADGVRTQSWKKIDGTGTQSALCMAVFDSKLYLLHTSYTNKKFFYQSYEKDAWSKLSAVDAPEIVSGLSASPWKYNSLVVTYKGDDSSIKYQAFSGEKWSPIGTVNGATMQYQTGLATFVGRLILSYGLGEKGSQTLTGYRTPVTMCEKSPFVSEEEVSDWDCKWNEPAESKSMLRKFFCM